jgi:lipoprotein-releasing system permease protein
MSVMNGFRKELLEKIVGVNGHIFAPRSTGRSTTSPTSRRSSPACRAFKLAVPLSRGRRSILGRSAIVGVLVRGMSAKDLKAIPLVAGNNVQQGSARRLRHRRRHRHRHGGSRARSASRRAIR